MYNCIRLFPARILYLELFDLHPVVKTLLHYSSLSPLEVQPYQKTDYKPMMMRWGVVACCEVVLGDVECGWVSWDVVGCCEVLLSSVV